MSEKRVTYFVVQGWKPQKGRRGNLVREQAHEASSASSAKRQVERYHQMGGAGIAFSRTGIPGNDAWDEAEIIAQLGEIPPEELEAMQAA